MDQLIKPRRYTALELIKLFWQSEHRLYAYLIFALIMTMTIGLVAFDVAFSYWFNYFYDALQAYRKADAFYLLLVFFGMAAGYIILAVYRYYISQLFGLRWRRWLTEQFIGRWLHHRDYYYLETFDTHTDNPDQRIQEDIAALINFSINLSMGLISAITTFFAFIYVLWSLSGVLHLDLGSLGEWHIPGYLVWVAIVYAMIGTFVTFKIGFPLVGLNFEQQRREANFRFAAIDVRQHAEHIALYQGEGHQHGILSKIFGGVLENWFRIIKRQKLLLWFTAGYNQIAVALPLLVALPNYFEKVFMLGGLMQSLRAFSSIQDALSFLVNSYTQIAEWRAVIQRLITFMNHMQDINEKVARDNQLTINKTNQTNIITQAVTIDLPNGKTLLKNINQTFTHGQDYLIKGHSGIGKSTFLRALAGVWPYAKGVVTMPSAQAVMYLPQKPYMPIGTLAEAMMFPDKVHPEWEAKLQGLLKDCNLSHLIPHLHETASWSQQLSPGEQQRIAFARVILHEPDWIFLDETTSMLDLANEKALYALLKTKLPQCSLVSVGHRPSLESFHQHTIDMAVYA